MCVTLSAWDLCFPSIFEDIESYVPSTTRPPTRNRAGGMPGADDRERDRDRDRERRGGRARPERGGTREREEEKKRHSYFEKPKVDDEVSGSQRACHSGRGCLSLWLPNQV